MLEEFVSANHKIMEIKNYTICQSYRLKNFPDTSEYVILNNLPTESQFKTERTYAYRGIEQTDLKWIGLPEELD